MNSNTTTFAAVPLDGQFVEVLSPCNEVATRIDPTTHQGKPVNARRDGGKLIFMADWEPAFIHKCFVDWIDNTSDSQGRTGWYKCDQHGQFMDDPYCPISGFMPKCPMEVNDAP